MSGFRLKEILGQVAVAEELDAALRSGGLLMSDDGSVTECPKESLDIVVSRPHVFFMTKEIVQRYLGTWTSLLFTYHEPILGFTRAEQRILEAALRGLTDDELTLELDLSISVREHPEELRPVSKKLLHQCQAGSMKTNRLPPSKLPRHRVGRARTNR